MDTKLQAFQFELKRLTFGEMRQLVIFAGQARFAFNDALRFYMDEHEKDKSFKFSYASMCKRLPKLKLEHPWLKECPAQVLQQALKNLESAFKRFWNKQSEFPKFKKKTHSKSFRYPQGFKLDEANGRIFLPKIGWVQYRASKKIKGAPKNVTVSYRCGKWYVSIQTEMEYKKPVHYGTDIGADMGCARFVTLSNGRYFMPINALKTALQRLNHLQRNLSRCVKGSANWKKAKDKLAKQYLKVTRVRKDFLNKLSTMISKNHAIVYAEDLKILNMLKCSRGLARSVLDQSWGEFFRQLEYKLEWNGGRLVRVNPAYTSQTCAKCGHCAKENRKTQDKFVCVSCGHSDNADHNAAVNIKRVGQTQLACEMSRAVSLESTRTLRSA